MGSNDWDKVLRLAEKKRELCKEKFRKEYIELCNKYQFIIYQDVFNNYYISEATDKIDIEWMAEQLAENDN